MTFEFAAWCGLRDIQPWWHYHADGHPGGIMSSALWLELYPLTALTFPG